MWIYFIWLVEQPKSNSLVKRKEQKSFLFGPYNKHNYTSVKQLIKNKPSLSLLNIALKLTYAISHHIYPTHNCEKNKTSTHSRNQHMQFPNP